MFCPFGMDQRFSCLPPLETTIFSRSWFGNTRGEVQVDVAKRAEALFSCWNVDINAGIGLMR